MKDRHLANGIQIYGVHGVVPVTIHSNSADDRRRVMDKRTAELWGRAHMPRPAGRHCLRQRHGYLGAQVVQTHRPGTWFLGQYGVQYGTYASPGVSHSALKIGARWKRATVAFPQALSRRGRQACVFLEKVQASFQDHTVQRSRPQRHSNPSICSASSSSTQPVRLSASSLHLRLPLVSSGGLSRPITPRSPSRDANSIDLAAASAAVHTR